AGNALPLNLNTPTETTAAQWDWKRHALTVPLEAFVSLPSPKSCDLIILNTSHHELYSFKL
ncbi:hypothetical protein D9A33_19065, partial [Vibrio cholerae]|nr:hypothetical protein [Vibrio cholerae]